MFTGLIGALGTVRELRRRGTGGQLLIASPLVHEELQLGESIAVNGACLTVTSWDHEQFIVDVSPETLQRTTLGSLPPRQPVNLERALRLSDRLGGHLVSGHVDCVGRLHRRWQDQNAVRMEFSLPAPMMRHLVEKGSVAVDGISLTVNTVAADMFSVAVIPHSLEMTTLKTCREGAAVNIETDLLGKYVERFLSVDGQVSPGSGAGIDRDFLAKNGFL